MSEATEWWCSFCGKQNAEVRKLIAGPRVYICNECVALCTEIVREADGPTLSGYRAGDFGRLNRQREIWLKNRCPS